MFIAPSLALTLAFAATSKALPFFVAPLSCPSGQILGSDSITVSFNATAAQVETIVGDFQASDWQGLPQTGKAGRDNAPGALRNASFNGIILEEQLLYYRTSQTMQEQVFRLVNGPIDLAPVGVPLVLNAYQEDVQLSTICSGAASQIKWDVSYCYTGDASLNTVASSIFHGAHAGGLANVTAILGTTFVACPGPAPSPFSTVAQCVIDAIWNFTSPFSCYRR